MGSQAGSWETAKVARMQRSGIREFRASDYSGTLTLATYSSDLSLASNRTKDFERRNLPKSGSSLEIIFMAWTLSS
jgi:hypothetical protein